MKNTLRLYWILNPIGQKKAFIGICMFGLIIAQLLLALNSYEDGIITFRAMSYCSYFLLLIFTMQYSFMNASTLTNEARKSNNIRICLQQMNNPKDVFIKGIIVNDLLIMLLYWLCSMVVMCILAIFNGFSTAVFTVTLWGCVIAGIAGIFFNIATSNGKNFIGGAIMISYIFFFIFAVLFDFNSSNTIALYYVSQAYSLLVLLPFTGCIIVFAYLFGRYCYKTRREIRKRCLRW